MKNIMFIIGWILWILTSILCDFAESFWEIRGILAVICGIMTVATVVVYIFRYQKKITMEGILTAALGLNFLKLFLRYCGIYHRETFSSMYMTSMGVIALACCWCVRNQEKEASKKDRVIRIIAFTIGFCELLFAFLYQNL